MKPTEPAWLDQMQRGNLGGDEQRTRMPNVMYRDRMTFYLGGKEIRVLYFGAAHTKGDSILFVPQDRIAYISQVFFNEEFPNMAGGYGVSWIRVLDAVRALDADIFIPGHGHPLLSEADAGGTRPRAADPRGCTGRNPE